LLRPCLFPIFYQNFSTFSLSFSKLDLNSKDKKEQNLGCKNFAIWDPKGPKLGKNVLGRELDAHYPSMAMHGCQLMKQISH
jgi:hypothetical protein